MEFARLANGRTPLTLAGGWGRDRGLKDVERSATSPGSPTSRLGQGYESHESCVSGFEDGSFGAIAVLVRSESRCNPSAIVSAEKYLVLSHVAVASTDLARNICNAVDQIHLTHVNGQRVR